MKITVPISERSWHILTQTVWFYLVTISSIAVGKGAYFSTTAAAPAPLPVVGAHCTDLVAAPVEAAASYRTVHDIHRPAKWTFNFSNNIILYYYILLVNLHLSLYNNINNLKKIRENSNLNSLFNFGDSLAYIFDNRVKSDYKSPICTDFTIKINTIHK